MACRFKEGHPSCSHRGRLDGDGCPPRLHHRRARPLVLAPGWLERMPLAHRLALHDGPQPLGQSKLQVVQVGRPDLCGIGVQLMEDPFLPTR